ncbi:MAG: ABC transporter substrate-binding protein [Clostridia bacterium]|nr:ABC transporter substrate-binding protein [Clostridia bacterium]
MKKFVKIISLIMALAFICLALASCGGGKKKIKVAIVQILDHTSLNQIRETIIADLNKLDYDIEIIAKNANGDPSTLASIYANLTDVDVVIPVTTPDAQSAKAAYAGTGTPLVFAAVTNPEEAGLVGEGCENITGVSDYIPPEEVLNLIKTFQPSVSKIGLVYTSSEQNSIATMNEIKALLGDKGMAFEEATIVTTSDLQSAVNTLISRGVEALYTNTDNTIASAMPLYTSVAYASGIPVYCGADSMVSDGGFASSGVDYVQIGHQVAKIVEQILGGKKPSEIPYQKLDSFATFVNLKAAKEIGIKISEETLNKVSVLVEEDGTSRFGK